MAGVKALRQIQLGKESTAGTPVAATVNWRGMGMLQDQRLLKWVNEDVGYLAGVRRTYTPKLLGAIGFEQVEATFEQLPYLFAAGVKNVTAGVQDGAGSDYLYTYPLGNTSGNTIQTYTIRGGDNQQAEIMEYAFVQAARLSGKGAEAVMMAGDWLGRQVATSTFTGSLSLPSVEEILFQKGKLYIDAVSGTIGSTQKTNTWLEFGLELKTGLEPRFTGDGNLYFSYVQMARPELTCKVVFEHDSAGVAAKADWVAETGRQIRMLFEGSTVATPGTTYSKKSLIIDLAGQWDVFNKIGDQDGNDVIEGTFRAAYDATAALSAQFLVVNELSALT